MGDNFTIGEGNEQLSTERRRVSIPNPETLLR